MAADDGTGTPPIELEGAIAEEPADESADGAVACELAEGATDEDPADETLDSPATWVNGTTKEVPVDDVRLVTDDDVLDDTILEAPTLERTDTDVVELVVEVVERLLTDEAVEKVVHVEEVLKLELDVLELVVDVLVVLVLEVVEVVD